MCDERSYIYITCEVCLIYYKIMKNAALNVLYKIIVVISKNDYLAVLTCPVALWHIWLCNKPATATAMTFDSSLFYTMISNC